MHRTAGTFMRVLRLSLGLLLALGTPTAGADEADDERPLIGCGKAQALTRKMLAEQLRRNELDGYGTLWEVAAREASPDTDLLHCDLAIEIFPNETGTNLAGTNTMTLQSKTTTLTQFTFRLQNTYAISSALLNGITPVTVTTASTTTRVVTLDRAYGMDEIFTLTIAYSGHANSAGFGSIVYASHSGARIVYTLSEPYYAYTWWPVKDGDAGAAGDNGDKFTLNMSITAPDSMVTASNGMLLSIDTLSGARKCYNWSTTYPLSAYLACFSSTNYNTWTATYTPLAGGSMPVLFYIYPEDDTTSNRNAWGQVVQMITTLRDYFGEYPFVNEKYGIYDCEFNGGMEHQTFTAQGTFSESVTVHELGHQWWGDMVTCKTWNHIWLNEGFATYAEALWAEHKPGSSGLPALKNTMAAKKYTGGGSVYVTDAELSSPSAIFDGNTSYNKGGWVLHMLRHVLGDANFFAALAAYRAAYEFQAATTEDFRAICEEFYGGSLNWFFQEWVYGVRTPAYAYGWSSVQVGGQNYLLLYIDQTQSTSYQRFTMPIDIVVNGTTYKVYNDADPENFVIPIPAAAATVQFDPDAWILSSAIATTAYVAGPPKIVAMTPAPGQTVDFTPATSAIGVTFHTNVNTTAANYALVGATRGTQPVNFAYDGATYTTTLTTIGSLLPDTYTLTVGDALAASDSGQTLDGEIRDPRSPSSLPSGDGVAGGAAVLSFTVAYPPGDMNCDGVISYGDVNPFVVALRGESAYLAQHPACNWSNADVNGDGDVNYGDINPFVALLGGR